MVLHSETWQSRHSSCLLLPATRKPKPLIKAYSPRIIPHGCFNHCEVSNPRNIYSGTKMKLTLSQLRALKRLTVLNLQDAFDVLNLPLTYLTFEELLRHDQLFRSDLERCLNRFQSMSAQFCSECGSFAEAGEDIGAMHVCDVCLNDHYFISDYSGSLFHTDSRVTVSTSNGSQAWTEQEFDLYGWVCDDCGERFSNQVESHETDGRSPRSICPSCVDEHDYRHCNDSELCG
ncbi:MAG: hypothetical protein NTX38_12370 [Methylobacter sp.]|nr:hypothetical protein [Methylobacter sp.]